MKTIQLIYDLNSVFVNAFKNTNIAPKIYKMLHEKFTEMIRKLKKNNLNIYKWKYKKQDNRQKSEHSLNYLSVALHILPGYQYILDSMSNCLVLTIKKKVYLTA